MQQAIRKKFVSAGDKRDSPAVRILIIHLCKRRVKVSLM
jgi:hypothetical protein